MEQNLGERGANLELSKKEMLTKLLQQIDLQLQPEDTGYFENGSISRVEVHQVSKRWDFIINLTDILPFQLFIQLQQHLSSAFQGIAQTTIAINATAPEVTNRKLGDYWQWVIANSGLRSNLTQSLCEGKVPYLQDGRVMLLADNEIIKDFLVNQALGPIEDTYRKVGFPPQNITTLVDESASQDKIDEYKEKRLKVMQNLHKRLFKRSRNKINKKRLVRIKKNFLRSMDQFNWVRRSQVILNRAKWSTSRKKSVQL
jgi:DNA polymerase III, alpha subunit (gram-positive type)